ncbi:DUF3152 domain-containing protein [Streptomyces sp. cg36]|uniref:DUF3152 domain-containing protein n=1 Tax=Streptomyces sp. cg36 TaxID=3238798 RepID=UPI0034E1C1B3
MGRHSRPKSAPAGPSEATATGRLPVAEGEGAGRRRRSEGPATGELPRVRPLPEHPFPQHRGDGTPAHGVPQARGGHPEHHEGGGGWGEPPTGPDAEWGARPAASGPGAAVRIPGPRGEYPDAFDGRGRTARQDRRDHQDRADTGTHRVAAAAAPGPVVPRPAPVPDPVRPVPVPESGGKAGRPGKPAKSGRGSKGRTFTGIAAAAVTAALAVAVAGQVTSEGDHHSGAQSAEDNGRGGADGPASRSKDRSTPAQAAPAKPVSYEEKMALQYPIDPKLKGSGQFETVPGFEAAPGKGRKYRYRVDIEKGLGLDGALFAEAVQKTLNDDRSWAHEGAKTFERVSSGRPDFVVTLASPGTTGVWCAKSELDVTEQNVSCDSAATERVMINAYRWAQGSETYGARAMYAYRQMLINHEVGHRLGHGHVNCGTPGALAPVMQQQTKSLDIDGIKCRANPWPYPTG